MSLLQTGLEQIETILSSETSLLAAASLVCGVGLRFGAVKTKHCLVGVGCP